MSSTHDSTPQPSALPATDSTSTSTSTTPDALPLSHPTHPITPPRPPLLRLRLDDLSTPGTTTFLRLVHATHALTHALNTVLTHLYTSLPTSSIPATRSVTLVLRAMDGVAYTTGLSLDDDHKEIHFNTTYIEGIAPTRQKEEIMGVLVHEMVHCWQRDACGTAPGGLIEGVADWVRLKAGLAPPHWKRRADWRVWEGCCEEG
ncbi:BSP-domain-containing protein [Pyrenophora tritici-repentis]|nr:BSP-domain-containing protein [Pyrenophora tritici-repentis]